VLFAHQLLAASLADASDGLDWSLILGAYGAVVASLVALYNWRRDRPKVNVQLMGEIHIARPENELFWQIRVLNDSTRPIAIEAVGLVNSDGLRIAANAIGEDDELTALPFPVTLDDGDPPVIVRTRRDLGDGVVGAYAMDYRQRFYEGKAVRRVWRWSPRTIKARRLAKKQEKAHGA
jgi:hypothetical protein